MALISEILNGDYKAEDYKNFLLQARNNFLKGLTDKYVPDFVEKIKNEGTFKILKRHEFEISKDNIPDKFLKYLGKEKENFGELINQMATVENMIFALTKWNDHYVSRAHPTQTSSKKGIDHDLILVKSGESNKLIEISDVISDKDSNRKFTKDVGSLYRTFSKKNEEKEEYFVVTSSKLWTKYKQPERLEDKRYIFELWKNKENDLYFDDHKDSRELLPVALEVLEVEDNVEVDTCILQIFFKVR